MLIIVSLLMRNTNSNYPVHAIAQLQIAKQYSKQEIELILDIVAHAANSTAHFVYMNIQRE